MGTLEGKVAVITGGTAGSGLAAAKRFVDEGAFVFITGRDQSALDEAKAFIGHDVMAIQGDVTNLADVQRLYAVVRDVKGHVDIVFANEGQAVTADYYDGIFNTDVRGVLFAVDGALPLMREGGSIMITAPSRTRRRATETSAARREEPFARLLGTGRSSSRTGASAPASPKVSS